MRKLGGAILSLISLFDVVAGCDDGRSSTADAGPACGIQTTFASDNHRKLDLLFVIDDSAAMATLDAKLATAYPALAAAFAPQDQQPLDLHVAVVSASLGGGRFTDVPGCEAGSPGDRQGRFSHPADSGLLPGETFMRMNGGPVNFTKDPGEVFAALARLGYTGCPYPQPLEAARRALMKAQDPTDADNAGFLRDDAALGIVIITNQDDCSVPADSDLFDPRQLTVADPYGAARPYRCAEFGWLCDGMSPPHALSPRSDPVPLDACTADPTGGHLTALAEVRAFLVGLKASPDDVMISMIAGPNQPVVLGHGVAMPAGGTPAGDSPALEASCSGTGGESALPAVRLKSFADTFGPNGLFLPACVPATTFSQALKNFLETIHIGSSRCLTGIPASSAAGRPSCTVTETHTDENEVQTRWVLSSCDADRTVLPCWKLEQQATCPGGAPELTVCRDPACSSGPLSPESGHVAIECQTACP